MEAEQSNSVLTRVLTVLSRRRMRLLSFRSYEKDDLLHITFIVVETDENVQRLSAQLEKQIDVFSVNFFITQEKQSTCKTEQPKSFLTL